MDEIWSFTYAKAKNVPTASAAPEGAGDTWTWTALDADSKLIVSWLVGARDMEYAMAFVNDVRERVVGRVQVTTDGHGPYIAAVENAFGSDVDYAVLQKIYGADPAAEKRYSPAQCIGVKCEIIQAPLSLEPGASSRYPTPMRLASFLVLAAVGASGCQQGEAPPAVRKAADVRLAPDSERLAGTVAPGATFAEILAAHGVAPERVQGFVESVEPVFSSRQLRAHHAYELERTLDGGLREFIYRIDVDRFLRAVPAAGPAGTADAAGGARPLAERVAVLQAGPPSDFHVELGAYRKDRGLVAIRGDIDRDHPSLVAALTEAGEDVSLAIALADLFSGDIDFNHDLQQGDSFEVLFEQVLREGARAGYGDIIAARFTNSGQTYTAFRYETPVGKPAYYDAEGRSLRRFFLASPLKFEPRVTSGFSVPPPSPGPRHPPAASRCRLRRPARRPGRRHRGRHRRLGGSHRRRRQHHRLASRRRLREPVPAPLGLRLGHARRCPRPAGPGDWPRRLDGPRDRSPSPLRAQAERHARQPGRRAQAPPARRARAPHPSRGLRRGARSAARAVRVGGGVVRI